MTKRNTTENRIERTARLRWVLISLMKVEAIAQRNLNPNWVSKLAANLDLDSIGYPILSYRDGHFYIIDGMHRIEALREHGFGEEKLECWVYEGLTAEQEAELFLQYNNKLNVRAMDRFKVAVTAGREEQCDIDRIVRANNCVISPDKIPGAIAAVGTLEKVYRRGGPNVLGRTVRILRDAYGDGGFEAGPIDGIGHLCTRYNGTLDEDRAIAKLSAAHGGVNGLMGKAQTIRRQTGNSLSLCVAAAAVDIINAGAKRNEKLPNWWAA